MSNDACTARADAANLLKLGEFEGLLEADYAPCERLDALDRKADIVSVHRTCAR
jgi:hypothetical protein